MAELPQTRTRIPVLAWRLGLLAFLLITEGLLAHLRIQRDYHAWTVRLGAQTGSFSIARWSLAFAVFSGLIGYRRMRVQFLEVFLDWPDVLVSRTFAVLHFCALAIFLTISSAPIPNWARGGGTPFLFGVWLCTGVAAVALAGSTFVPVPIWRRLLRGTVKLWLSAAAVSGIVIALSQGLWAVWDESRLNFAADITFWLVRQMLRPFLHDVRLEAGAHIIGSDKFQIKIAGVCSGWEGIALAMVFSIVWLWLERREYRFPQALVLIPGAMISIFLLNAVRLAVLILIGHHGYPGVAMSGFHSQAGWIAFNGLVLGITLIAPRIGWFRAGGPGVIAKGDNPAVAFLLPFAVILAAGAVSKATSQGFEWLYPLRFVAAAVVLWAYRRHYSIQREIPDWSALFAGAIVFVMWIALDHGPTGDNGIGTGLAGLSAPGRFTWIVSRVLAATVTVPLAEELAFRGFLARRIVSADFELIDYRRLSLVAVVGSSIAFGLMHGERWLAGTVAGVVYAAAMMRRGKIGDAAAAHAITNALLAFWVLSGSRWSFW